MLLLLAGLSLSLDNGLALTPPMGWMQWEQFRCEVNCDAHPDTCISEQLIVDMIDHMADDGWLEYGYEYVNIDDCWMGPGRDENGEIYPDKKRFPHGIAWLADYAHKKGVKLGIYNDYGTLTCGGYTGSQGHLNQDAKTFASWNVDMLKMDGCYSELFDMNDGYPGMTHFLNKTGRPIMYSCSWPAYYPSMNYSRLPEHCNLWRNYGDITCTWGALRSIIDKWGNMTDWQPHAGPGHWNDPDQLVIGMTKNEWVPGITTEEEKTQMSMWAIFAAPLIFSNDMRRIPDSSKEVLRNKEVIAVDQDKLGKQGYRVTDYSNDLQVWVRELEGGELALALLNRGEQTADITAKFSDFTKTKTWALRDLWLHKDLGDFTDSYTAKAVAGHSTILLRMKPKA